MAKIQDKLYNRIIEGELLELTKKEKDKLGIGYLSQNGNTTKIGGSLEVNGSINVNSFTNIMSKKGETHYMETYYGYVGDDDIEIIDASAHFAFIKLIITNIDVMATYEYVYTDDDGWNLVNSSGETTSFTLQAVGGILTLKAVYSQPTKVIALIDMLEDK